MDINLNINEDLLAIIILLVGIALFCAIVGIITRIYNSTQPVLSREATVISKRTDISVYSSTSSTHYHITYEFDNGERMECGVSESEYGQLIEGDKGILITQGISHCFKRYIS